MAYEDTTRPCKSLIAAAVHLVSLETAQGYVDHDATTHGSASVDGAYPGMLIRRGLVNAETGQIDRLGVWRVIEVDYASSRAEWVGEEALP
ncbi:MAG: hypothetical protein RIB60_06075 [Phycisphaerales bacterium]